MNLYDGFCIFCDIELSGFEHDLCVNCQYEIEEDGLDVEDEIKKRKEELNIVE